MSGLKEASEIVSAEDTTGRTRCPTMRDLLAPVVVVPEDLIVLLLAGDSRKQGLGERPGAIEATRSIINP